MAKFIQAMVTEDLKADYDLYLVMERKSLKEDITNYLEKVTEKIRVQREKTEGRKKK